MDKQLASDPTPERDALPIRIWVTPCAFKKSGFPSLGTFGATVGNVVILRMETWQRLCREIPELGKRQFEVGAEHGD